MPGRTRFEILHAIGVREIARQLRGRSLELARTEPEIAPLQGRLLRAALGAEQPLAAVDPQLAGVVLLQHLAAHFQPVPRILRAQRGSA